MLQLSPDGWCLVVLEEANAWKGYDLSEGWMERLSER